jgi:hypothetical protein
MMESRIPGPKLRYEYHILGMDGEVRKRFGDLLPVDVTASLRNIDDILILVNRDEDIESEAQIPVRHIQEITTYERKGKKV